MVGVPVRWSAWLVPLMLAVMGCAEHSRVATPAEQRDLYECTRNAVTSGNYTARASPPIPFLTMPDPEVLKLISTCMAARGHMESRR